MISKVIRLLVCFMVLCSVISNSGLIAYAVETMNTEVLAEDLIPEEAIFAENEILVIFDNKKSMEFNNYTKEFFNGIDCSAVLDLSSSFRQRVKQTVDDALNEITQGNIPIIDEDIDMSYYYQILHLTLEENNRKDLINTINKINKIDGVMCAMPNFEIALNSSTTTSSVDSSTVSYTSPSQLYSKLGLTDFWNTVSSNTTVRVAIMDSGIDENHPDLSGLVNRSLSREFSNTGTASNINDEVIDDRGHGTHVAGIIAGKYNSTLNVRGVSSNVELVSLKILNESGKGTVAALISAMNYVKEQTGDNRINIINISADCENVAHYMDSFTELRQAILGYSGLMVCAAGNKNKLINENGKIPAGMDCDNIISVGASTYEDDIWEESEEKGSNYGCVTVDLFAPGVSILSTTPTGMCESRSCQSNNLKGTHVTNGYHVLTGTSMAAPFVTGVAALLLSIDNTLTPQQIKDYIIDSVDDCDGNFEDLCVSDGRLNAYGALLELRNNCNHNYDYSHSANSHVSTCTICNHQETFNYALYVSSRTSSSITVKCMDCNEQIVCSHSRQYQSLGDSSHKITCNSCGIWVTDLHSKQYADPESNTEHIASCSLCDYSTVEEHNLYVIEVDEDDTLHIGCDLCSLYIMCDHNIYECQDTLTHVVDCMDCDICFTEEHKYSITNVNNSNHKVRCDVCGYAYYQSHNYYEASWEEFMEVGCTKCSLSIDCIHVEEYDYDDTTHSIGCTSCGYEITGTHNFYRCVNTGSALYHTSYCWDCEYTKSVSHIFLYSSTDNELNHGVYCSDCGYLGTQSHTWVLTLGGYECMYCGQISSSTPSNPIASIPPKNDEELSE